MASYETDLQNLKTAQRNAAIADLENTRNKALSDLQAEQRQNAATYNTQRNTANTQNRMNAKNFQEYLASTGRANSGLSSQAKMQYGNNLSTSINNLNAGEAAALADINRRTTDAQNSYNTGLAGANAQIEADYITNLMSERNKELDRQLQQRENELNRQLQERQLQEQIRQFNENLALQKQQLQSRFSSGSGGGGGYTGTSNNNNITTAFYSGAINPDAKNGTFSNGYQPDNVGGQKLKATGQTVKVASKTLQGTKVNTNQKVWKTADGTKYVWDGSKNKYIKVNI